MVSFLSLVARDLYHKTGGDLRRTAIVFPNKRASLFMNEYLAAQCDGPMWAPAYLTISDLFRRLSPLKASDSIRLVCELYEVFRQATGSEETLDDFFFWGELLISDFDDADKNMVDTRRLFSNLQDLHQMDDLSFLTAEQEEALHQFFCNFSPERHTELKEKFVRLWNRLGDIYRHFRQRLADEGIAYEGMLYRDVIERLEAGELDAQAEMELNQYDRYVFVGFNVLNQVETHFFRRLHRQGRAMFYWDYDVAYTHLPRLQEPPYTHEAGEFLLRNLKDFPNELDEACFDNLRSPKRIRFLSAPTENAQARLLSQELKTEEDEVIGKDTAVVLCNEALLLPVLHSLPETVEKVNITMGFPLSQTPVYSLVNALAELQVSGYQTATGRYQYESVLSVLKHAYIRRLSPMAESIEKRLVYDNRFYPLPSELQADEALTYLFTPVEGCQALCNYLAEVLRRVAALFNQETEDGQDGLFDQLYRESVFNAYTVVNRLLSLLTDGTLTNIRVETMRRLLARLLTAASIPFHGEPAVGMQVMGVLETRNLDFRRLIMLSVNEGQLPKGEGDSSFIPHNLRRAFGMTTIEHKNAVYAYYFYRLIQRAEDITLLYNTSSDGLNRGEMSRFMLQLQIEAPQDIQCISVEAEQSPRRPRVIRIDKTPALLAQLHDLYDAYQQDARLLSPSAINTYLDCRLKFYFHYLAKLRAPEEVTAEIDSALFGTLFHRAAERMYGDLTAHGHEITKEDITRLLKDKNRLEGYVDAAFREKFFHAKEGERPEYNGTQLIHARVITSYIRQLLRNDLRYAPFRMEKMEHTITEDFTFPIADTSFTVRLGGTIDRMDSQGDTLRIVDYKTGGTPKRVESIEQLFQPGEQRAGYVLQVFLYAAMMCKRQPLKVSPALLYIHKAAAEDYSPIIEIGPSRKKEPVLNFALYEDEFRERLTLLLQELFGAEVPFTQTEDTAKCEYCDFRRLCNR